MRGLFDGRELIKNNKAILLTGVEELLETMGWAKKKVERERQRELFIELTEQERQLLEIIKKAGVASIDEINLQSGLSSSQVAAALLSLELQNIIQSLPGKRYSLI